jgi:putative ABC transport system ATP-binding protein
VGGLTRTQLALLRRHYLGFVFQGFNLLNRTTAVENVELPLVYRGVPKSARRELALAALNAVGLADRARHTPSELSGGQQQRVAIARAIVTEPLILLADEPTGNLDTERGIETMDLIKSFNVDKHITIVLVTHEREMAEYAGRILHFRDGLIESETAGSRTNFRRDKTRGGAP